MQGFQPGIAPAKLTKEPLGTQGELSPGPDELDPSIPEQQQELVDRGYLDPPENRDSVDDVLAFESFDESQAPSPSLEFDAGLPDLPQF